MTDTGHTPLGIPFMTLNEYLLYNNVSHFGGPSMSMHYLDGSAFEWPVVGEMYNYAWLGLENQSLHHSFALLMKKKIKVNIVSKNNRMNSIEEDPSTEQK